VVALHAGDRGVDDFEVDRSQDGRAVVELVDGFFAGFGVADDSSLADVLATYFELGLDEDDGGSLPWRFGGAEGGDDCGEDEGRGDEGDVHGEEGRRGCVGGEEFAFGEEAGVGSFAEGDARIVAEFLGDLAVAGVDCQDGFCAALQHAIGEASGGGSYVEACEVGKGDVPMGEGVLEFEASSGDVFEIGAKQADDGVGRDGSAGLVDALLIDEDAASEDKGLGSLAGGGVALIDEEFVEADFFAGRRGHLGLV